MLYIPDPYIYIYYPKPYTIYPKIYVLYILLKKSQFFSTLYFIATMVNFTHQEYIYLCLTWAAIANEDPLADKIPFWGRVMFKYAEIVPPYSKRIADPLENRFVWFCN